MPTTRLMPIQGLRAVAASLVLVVHGAESIGHTGVAVEGALVPSIPNLVTFGASGVDLFFVISGFVMAQALALDTGGPRLFLIARWRRIVPLFLLVSGAFVLACRDTIAWQSLLMSVTVLPLFDGADYHAPALFVGWTLGFEFAFYALVAIAMRRERHRVAALLALTLGAAAAGLFLHPGWAPLRLLFNPMQGEFALGIAAWAAWRHGWTERFGAWALAIGVALLACGILIGLGVPVQTHYLAAADGSAGLARSWTWGLPWALVLAGVVDISARGRLMTPIARIGDASYSTYLVHPCLLATAWIVAPYIPPITAATFVAAFVASATLAGLLVHVAVERPLLTWLAHRSATDPRRRPGQAGTARAWS